MDTAGETNRPFQSIGGDDHGVGTVDGAGVDLSPYRDALVMVNLAGVTATGTVDITLQESDDDGVGDAYVLIPGAVFAQLLPGTTPGMFYARLKRSGPQTYKKFVRAVAVVGTATGQFGVAIVGLDPKIKPDANSSALVFSV